MKRILRRGHPGALSSIPIPPPLFLPLPGPSPGSEASGPNKASTLLLSSSLSPDSCRLLMSSTRRQWRERGTGADWCLPACQWRFLPLPFFLPASFSRYRQDKAVYSKVQRPLLTFPVKRQRDHGERPAIYRWVDMRTRPDAQCKTEASRHGEKRDSGTSERTHWCGISAKSLISWRPQSIILSRHKYVFI